MIASLLILLHGVWLGTALTWFTVDDKVLPLHSRIWRAVTWLPSWVRLIWASSR